MKGVLLSLALLLAGGLAMAQTPPSTPPAGGPPPMVPGPGVRRPLAAKGGPAAPMMIPEQAPAIRKLPQEKQDKVHQLNLDMREKMMALGGQMEAQNLALGEALRAFPIDQAGARKAEAEIVKVHGQMFDARLQALAKAQQIIGKDAWNDLQSERRERAMERRGPPMRGPGPVPPLAPPSQGGQK